jgi:hypothetical protein
VAIEMKRFSFWKISNSKLDRHGIQLEINNKRGQAMIWVIVALVLVAIIILFFLYRGQVTVPTLRGSVAEDPRAYVGSCVKKNVNDVVDIILPQGGFVSPLHSKLYNDINVSYLCYNRGNYNPCINEHPLLLSEMEGQIKRYIEPEIERCFEDYKFEMDKRQVIVNLGPSTGVEVNLGPGNVYVDIMREMIIKENEETRRLDEFNFEILNPIYNLGRVAMEITSQEAEYCNFEHVGYMILYPEFRISVFPMSDSTKIYSIIDKNSEMLMNIAIRSCAIPPGF